MQAFQYSSSSSRHSAMRDSSTSAATPKAMNRTAGQQQGTHGHTRAFKACNYCRSAKVRCEVGDVDRPNAECARCLREGVVCEKRDQRIHPAPPGTPTFIDGDGSTRKRSRTQSAATSAHANSSVDQEWSSDTSAERGPTAGLWRMHSSSNMALAADVDCISIKVAPAEVSPGLDQRFVIAAKNLALNDDERTTYMSTRRFTDTEINLIQDAWERVYFCQVNRAFDPAAFTPVEGMTYVQKFYEHLAPLTPITGVLMSYYNLNDQIELLDQHPVLAVTVLTIASRYFEPGNLMSGPVAAFSPRAEAIHAGLCQLLCKLIDEMLWSPGEIGHGIQSTGVDNSFAVNQSSWPSKLRSFSTIEALLLQTEWHPRNFLRFRPSSKMEMTLFIRPRKIGAPPSDRQSPGGYVEHCRKNNRTSWTLLTLAYNMAAELGLWEPQVQNPHARAIGVLLYLTMQTNSLKFGLGSSWMPTLPNTSHAMLVETVQRTASHPCFEEKADPGVIAVHMLFHWHEIVAHARKAHADLFESREATNILIYSRAYRVLVQNFDDEYVRMSKQIGDCRKPNLRNQRRMLNLELQYYRVYILTIVVRAICRRADAKLKNNGRTRLPLIGEDIGGEDRALLFRLFEAGRSFLQTVDTFNEDDSFRYLPEHSYFRIVAVCATLAKCIYMGQDPTATSEALQSMRAASEALNNSVVDSDHIGPIAGRIIANYLQLVEENLVHNADEPQKFAAAMNPPPAGSMYANPATNTSWSGVAWGNFLDGFDGVFDSMTTQ